MKNGHVAVVTGGAGFIGSHMVDLLLDQGFTVRAIDDLSAGRLKNLQAHKNESALTFEERDVRKLRPREALFRGASYVFHFAGLGDIVPSIEKPADYLSTNVIGTVGTLEAARNAGVRKFLYAASSSCYGLAEDLPTTEEAEIDPQYPYALSKLLGEQAALHWGAVYDMPVVSLRIFNAYGPRSRTTGAYGAVFGVFFAQKLAGKPFTVVGDGSQSRDFVFVKDVAAAFLMAAESDRGNEVYNLGSGSPQSVNYLVELLGGDVTYVPKRPGEPDCTWADISKISDQLGWEPTTTFQVGVDEMLRDIDYWSDAPVWDPVSIQAATEPWFAALRE